MLQHLWRQRIEPAAWDRIIGERRAGRVCRIVNGSGEHAIALGRRGHYALAGDSGSQPGALPVGEEKRLVLAEGPTHRQAVLVPAKLRPPAWLRKVVPGVQVFVAKELKQCAVELVAAGFPDHRSEERRV